MSGVAEILSASREVLFFMEPVIVSKYRNRGFSPDLSHYAALD